MLKRSTVFALLFGLCSFILFIYKIQNSLIYHPDFARDLYEILKIAQGDLTLLGPKLSFGGLYSGPYYFYLFVPAFLLSGLNIMALPLFNAFLFSCALGYFAKKTIEKYTLWKGTLATLCLSVITLTVFAARSPNNGTSYIALLLVFLTIIHFEKIDRPLKLSLLGLLFGVIINFTFAILTLLPSVFIMVFLRISRKRDMLFFISGMVLSFIPLGLFEIKNNFIMLKNTFVDQSYLAWIQNESIAQGAAGKKNIFKNLLFITGPGQIQSDISVHPLLAYLMATGVYAIERLSSQKLLLMHAGLALFVVTLFTRFQFAHHYLYPVAFFLFFSFLVILLESKFSFLLGLVLFIAILSFPVRLYKTSTVPVEPFQRAARYSIAHNLIDKNTRFNVAYIASPNAIVGYEFRYFFQKYGYPPQSEFEYAGSDTLLLFTQKKNFDPSRHNTWETQQFGRKYLEDTQTYYVGSFTIYKAEK